jgi:membrane protein
MTWVRLKSALTFGGLSPGSALSRTWHEMMENEVMTRAAAIAFYAMLASVPFLSLMITLAVQALPEDALVVKDVHNQTVSELEATMKRVLPEESAEVVTEQIKRMREHPPFALLSIGLLVTIWTASSLFLAVIEGMNAMYDVKETRSFLRLRLTAIVMTLIQAVILIATLVAIVAGPEILSMLGLSRTAAFPLILVGQWIAVAAMILLSFALVFYVAPDVQQRWEWITPGSLYGTACIVGLTLLFRVYVQNWGNYQETYGSLGGVMVLLLWLWLSALVLLAAAQLNQVAEAASPVGKSKGQKIDPTEPPDFSKMAPQVASEQPERR